MYVLFSYFNRNDNKSCECQITGSQVNSETSITITTFVFVDFPWILKNHGEVFSFFPLFELKCLADDFEISQLQQNHNYLETYMVFSSNPASVHNLSVYHPNSRHLMSSKNTIIRSTRT